MNRKVHAFLKRQEKWRAESGRQIGVDVAMLRGCRAPSSSPWSHGFLVVGAWTRSRPITSFIGMMMERRLASVNDHIHPTTTYAIL